MTRRTKLTILAVIIGLALSVVVGVGIGRAECSGYTVQPGDNLFRIALNHGQTTAQIMAANGLQQTSILYPGDCLLVGKTVVALPPTANAPATYLNTIQFGGGLFNLQSMPIMAPSEESHNPGIIYQYTFGSSPSHVFVAHSDAGGQWMYTLKLGDTITLNLNGDITHYQVTSAQISLGESCGLPAGTPCFSSADFLSRDKLVMATCYPEYTLPTLGDLIIRAKLIK